MKAVCWIFALILVPHLAAAFTQDALEEARRHYDAAGYEEALSTLAAAKETSHPRLVQIEQYRALCFIALNRMSDAERAITALVSADPLYMPSSSVASPKALGVIAGVRAKALPAVARRLLERGRAAFTEKNFEQARDDFALLLRLLDDPAMQHSVEREDLRVLASGFSTLAAASASPPPAPALPEDNSAPAMAANPVNHAVIPPVPVREEFPTWAPDRSSARHEYSGTLQLQIGVDGRVTSAKIQEPSHPAYDHRLIEVARSWIYQPATRAGKPVESDRRITYNLRPPQ